MIMASYYNDDNGHTHNHNTGNDSNNDYCY